jgi:hypothetical protein
MAPMSQTSPQTGKIPFARPRAGALLLICACLMVLTVSALGILHGRPGTGSRSDQFSGLRASISSVCGTSGVVSHSSEVTR